MEERLISKKDLLKATGISYGQLYRWKRKNIIPEEWFIKKSAITGQETFFPREEILERINEIVKLKDEVSLDELSVIFSGKVKKGYVRKEYLIEKKIVSEYILDKLSLVIENKEKYSSDELIIIIIFNEMIEAGFVSLEEALDLVGKIKSNYSKINENECLIVKRKFGVMFYYLTQREKELINDAEAKLLIKIDFAKVKKVANTIL